MVPPTSRAVAPHAGSDADGPSGRLPLVTAVRGLAGDVRVTLVGHDIWLIAGGLTFYAGIAVVPLVLLGLWLAGLAVGAATVRDLALQLAEYAPESLGLSRGLRELAEIGPTLGLLAAVAALVPATSYGEGLVRAFDRLGGRLRSERRAWRGRLRSLVLLAVLPGITMLGLVGLAALPELVRGHGVGALLLGLYATFWVGWISSSLLMAATYRGFAPEPMGARALFWGCSATGSFLTGMSLAWVAILEFDLEFARAYGGAEPVAAVVLAALYLFLVQLVVLIGYVLTLRLADRGGRPLGPRLRPRRLPAGARESRPQASTDDRG